MKDLQTEAQRRHAIAWAVALTAQTPLAPDQYEYELLEEYAQGNITLNQVLAKLDRRVHHLLYHSKATRPLGEMDLTELVEQSQAWNEQHGITGMLCYSDGAFVQVLEGTQKDVNDLFARIRQDRRHTQVQALSSHSTSKRWFADWRMAFVDVEAKEFYWLLGYLEARGHNLVRPQIPITSQHLMVLLKAFSAV